MNWTEAIGTHFSVQTDQGCPAMLTVGVVPGSPLQWTPDDIKALTQALLSKTGTITLTDYGFRLIGAPLTYGNQGLKQYSHVRRFVCY